MINVIFTPQEKADCRVLNVLIDLNSLDITILPIWEKKNSVHVPFNHSNLFIMLSILAKPNQSRRQTLLTFVPEKTISNPRHRPIKQRNGRSDQIILEKSAGQRAVRKGCPINEPPRI